MTLLPEDALLIDIIRALRGHGSLCGAMAGDGCLCTMTWPHPPPHSAHALGSTPHVFYDDEAVAEEEMEQAYLGTRGRGAAEAMRAFLVTVTNGFIMIDAAENN